MHHLVRTRSQHFVSSPRKSATPLKHKLVRHPSKRRRLGSTAFAPSRAINVSDEEESDDDDPFPQATRAGPSRSRDSLLGFDDDNRHVNIASHARTKSSRSKENVRDQRLEGNVVNGGVHTSDDESSPKKRKRGGRDEDDDGGSDGDSSSWVEMEEDDDEEEEEPDFIAESDQHLLQDAPAYALHRLRKAELVRLWKVAGMWSTEEDDDESVHSAPDEDDDGGVSKKELVDGLIAARRHSAERVSPITSPRISPKRKAALEAAFEIKRLRSASSSVNGYSGPVSAASSSNSERRQSRPTDTDATPRAVPRTRAKFRKSEATLLRSAQRRTANGQTTRAKKGKGGLFRARSKSMDDRKARFGDEVKSPAKGLLNRRTRRSSTLSSIYTTTDTSPPENPAPSRQTPRRRKSVTARVFTPANRFKQLGKLDRDAFSASINHEVIEILSSDESDDDDGGAEPTPLVQRLRSRSARNSFVKEQSSEVEADGEDESEAEGSPVFQRLRSRDRAIDSDVSIPAAQVTRRNSRLLPDRGAKRKAMEALKGGESEEDEEAMELDEPLVEDPMELDGDVDDGPHSGPRTRSQRREKDPDEPVSDSAYSASLTPLSPSPEADLADPEQMEEEDSITRHTRSGKAFGQWQTRKNKLRQEAIDDPDMESYEDTDDDDEADDGQYEADVDLANATLSSLVRLLRDELVQMCEARGIEVGGTKPQLAKALLEWRDEQIAVDEQSTTSSQATARPKPPKSKKIIHAIGSNVHITGKTTPVLLRDHIHATDPATPPHSDESKRTGEAELNLDLSELGLEDSMIKPSQLQKLEKIGSGGFKDVYVGKFRGRKVAISEFREHLGEMDIRELKLLAEFSHPNIVKFRGICIPEDNSQVPCMLVSELCENGDLFDYIRNVPCPSLKRVLSLMLDIARGLEYLHTRKPAIIHRDCKSSNILINRAGVAKVGDFGLARVKHSTRSMIRSLVGTVNWQAPELWHPAPRYDYKVDVFSAAMVYWEMMSGWIGEKKYPWEGHNEHYIYDAVGHKHRRPSVAGLRKHWGDEPVNLMERMWHQDPGERPTMTDVVSDLEVLYAEL